MLIAYKKVISNKGASGVDSVTVEEIKDYVNQNWKDIKNQIKTRKYKPQPVKRVEIPKPNGGTRKLGIPAVMDRIIQQAMVQKLEPICEPGCLTVESENNSKSIDRCFVFLSIFLYFYIVFFRILCYNLSKRCFICVSIFLKLKIMSLFMLSKIFTIMVLVLPKYMKSLAKLKIFVQKKYVQRSGHCLG